MIPCDIAVSLLCATVITQQWHWRSCGAAFVVTSMAAVHDIGNRP